MGIKELEKEKLSLQADSECYSDQVSKLNDVMAFTVLFSLYLTHLCVLCLQVQRLQQKLHIMTEMYQENELKLHRC